MCSHTDNEESFEEPIRFSLFTRLLQEAVSVQGDQTWFAQHTSHMA